MPIGKIPGNTVSLSNIKKKNSFNNFVHSIFVPSNFDFLLDTSSLISDENYSKSKYLLNADFAQ